MKLVLTTLYGFNLSFIKGQNPCWDGIYVVRYPSSPNCNNQKLQLLTIITELHGTINISHLLAAI